MQFNNKKYANPRGCPGGWSQQELKNRLALSFSKVQISRLPHSRVTPLTCQIDKPVSSPNKIREP